MELRNLTVKKTIWTEQAMYPAMIGGPTHLAPYTTVVTKLQYRNSPTEDWVDVPEVIEETIEPKPEPFSLGKLFPMTEIEFKELQVTAQKALKPTKDSV
jgi:hypothetical protein